MNKKVLPYIPFLISFLLFLDCRSALPRYEVQVTVGKVGISQPGKDKYIVFPFDMAEGLQLKQAVENRRKIIEDRNREKAEMALVKTGLTVLERSRVDKLVNEMTFSKTGLTESDGLNIGKLLNANYALFGKITHYNVAKKAVRAHFIAEVIVKAVDIETGVIAWEAILKGHSIFNNGEQTLLDVENTLYDRLSKKLKN